MAAFPPLTTVQHHNGWGPNALPTQFANMPFATFSKGERVGRIADWIQGPTQHGGRGPRVQYSQIAQGPFAFRNNEDDDSFQLVDTKDKAPRAKSYVTLRPARGYGYGRGRGGQGRGRGSARGGHHHDAAGSNAAHPQTTSAPISNPQQPREPSVYVKESWQELAVVPFSNLNKAVTEPPEPSTIEEYGRVMFYDKTNDRLTCKTDKKLKRVSNVVPVMPTTSEDPILCELAKKGTGNVFATDTILATLMAATRSVFSWDIVVTKRDGNIFLDKRAASRFDQMTVHETHPHPPPEEKEPICDSQPSLALEAAHINANFLLNTAPKSKEFVTLGPQLPHNKEGSGAVRYRLFPLEEDDIKIVCRCTIDAAIKINNRDELLTVRALNEYDPRVAGLDWRKQLDSQRGAVFASEIKYNNNKVAKWCILSMLSGADQIKIGFVSRVNPRDPYNHTILGTHMNKPQELANQMAIREANIWGVVKYIYNLMARYEDGKYVLLKDATTPCLRLFAVPADEFDD